MDAVNTEQTELADDFLFGAEMIAAYLTSLGLPTTAGNVYYARKCHRLPIGRYSKHLIASKKKLTRAVQELVA